MKTILQSIFGIQCHRSCLKGKSLFRRSLGLILLLTMPLAYCKGSIPPKPKLNAEEKAQLEEKRFPIGCRPVGHNLGLKVLTLYPGKESALQSLYFVYNQSPVNVSLYQMRDKDSELSTRYNHTIQGHSWAALATGEPFVQFICAKSDGKNYGKIVDCAQSLKVCQYVNVKFGLNNKGNFWLVNSNTRNGAVNQVVYYGIIPGV